MDYLDVIVHVFTPEAREFYRLEQLWGEAPRRAVRQPPACRLETRKPLVPSGVTLPSGASGLEPPTS